MARRFLLALTALVLAIALVGCGSSEKIQILHFNDFHAMMQPSEKAVKKDGKDVKDEKGKTVMADAGGGIARLVKAIKDRKNDSTVVAFAGDMLQGTPFSTLFQGADGFDLMNDFVDVGTIGNHEFDYGQENLRKLLAMAKFPVVCANVMDASNALFAKSPYVIKEVKGVKIGIFGVVTEETVVTTHPRNVKGLTFEKPAETAKRMVDVLKDKEKVDVVVALSHIGSEEDVKLAQAVDGIDVIIGGHSHTVLTNGRKVKNTLIAQAGYYGRHLGVITLEVDPADKKLKSASASLVAMDAGIGFDEATKARVDEYAKKLSDEIKQVIAKAATKLEGDKSLVRNQETNLGNFICDVTRDLGKADLAVVNGGGIRASIAAGDVTIKDVMTVLPFDNSIVVVEMSGAAIAKMFDKVAAKEKEKGNFLHVSSGTKYTIKDKKAVDIVLAGAPIDPVKIYRVATSDFLAAGGDGFDEFKSGRTLDTGFMMRDAIIDVIKSKGVIDAKVEGRIIIK